MKDQVNYEVNYPVHSHCPGIIEKIAVTGRPILGHWSRLFNLDKTFYLINVFFEV
jgi:hypothetical protein